MTTNMQRSDLAELMRFTVAHEPQIDYPVHDVRGVRDAETFRLSRVGMEARLTYGGRLMMDCSAGVTCLCKWAGLDDPNGLEYRYAGDTGTLLAHLRHYTNPSSAYVGALVVFGPGTGDHVCMVLERGADPLLWSHGFEGGPILIRLSLERRFHRPPVTFCSIGPL